MLSRSRWPGRVRRGLDAYTAICRAVGILAGLARFAAFMRSDRFSLAIDAVDRMVSFRATESSASEALLNQQIACRNQAYEFGIDPPESRTDSGRCKRRSG
jgi:hypothetical protein